VEHHIVTNKGQVGILVTVRGALNDEDYWIEPGQSIAGRVQRIKLPDKQVKFSVEPLEE
jgi:hypothetical protein